MIKQVAFQLWFLIRNQSLFIKRLLHSPLTVLKDVIIKKAGHLNKMNPSGYFILLF